MTQRYMLDFERPILEIEAKLQELKSFSVPGKADFSAEIRRLERKLQRLQSDVFARLTPWQRCQIARHPNRPYTLDYVKALFSDCVELHGDRAFADDRAVVAGLARLDGAPVVVVGHQKGRDTKEKIVRNFGMANPEGYRKALRVMRLGEKFGCPVITFIDTPGAYPGIGAEERGQAEAIAQNLRAMAEIQTPVVVVVAGEGGSGGALALGVGDAVLMLEHAIYSVISPEGCASILWRDPSYAPQAAENLGLTSGTLKRLGLVDEVVPEPLGGAHRNPSEMATTLKGYLLKALHRLRGMSVPELLDQRYQKFRRMGLYEER